MLLLLAMLPGLVGWLAGWMVGWLAGWMAVLLCRPPVAFAAAFSFAFLSMFVCVLVRAFVSGVSTRVRLVRLVCVHFVACKLNETPHQITFLWVDRARVGARCTHIMHVFSSLVSARVCLR